MDGIALLPSTPILNVDGVWTTRRCHHNFGGKPLDELGRTPEMVLSFEKSAVSNTPHRAYKDAKHQLSTVLFTTWGQKSQRASVDISTVRNDEDDRPLTNG